MSNVWWQAYSRPSPPLSEGWKGYIVMAHAVIDSETAWAEAQQLTSFDDGNTRSNTLYWIASREGAADCPDCTTKPPVPTDHPTQEPTTTTHGPLPGGCDCHPGGVTTDPRCHDCGNDPWGCLGCQACGVDDCRFCGFDAFVDIPC